jgi:hypothetical protein
MQLGGRCAALTRICYPFPGRPQATPLFPELLQRAINLVEECPCSYQRGCPACVQHLECKNYVSRARQQGCDMYNLQSVSEVSTCGRLPLPVTQDRTLPRPS